MSLHERLLFLLVAPLCLFCLKHTEPCKAQNMSAHKTELFDILGEERDGRLVYKIRVKNKEKLAKYEGMKLWLAEMGEGRMLQRLEDFYMIVEMSEKERIAAMKKVSKTKSTEHSPLCWYSFVSFFLSEMEETSSLSGPLEGRSRYFPREK